MKNVDVCEKKRYNFYGIFNLKSKSCEQPTNHLDVLWIPMFRPFHKYINISTNINISVKLQKNALRIHLL